MSNSQHKLSALEGKASSGRTRHGKWTRTDDSASEESRSLFSRAQRDWETPSHLLCDTWTSRTSSANALCLQGALRPQGRMNDATYDSAHRFVPRFTRLGFRSLDKSERRIRALRDYTKGDSPFFAQTEAGSKEGCETVHQTLYLHRSSASPEARGHLCL